MSEILQRVWHRIFGHGDWVLDIIMLEKTEYECIQCGKQWTGAGWREKYQGKDDVYPSAIDKWYE